MATLSLAEKRLLRALPPDGAAVGAADAARLAGFGSEAEAMGATGGPERAGLLSIREQVTEAYRATEEGLRRARDGLAERRAVAALLDAGGPVPLAELAGRAGLAAEDATVAVGWLRRKGWARMEKGPAGTMVAAASPAAPAQGDDETLLAQAAAAGELPVPGALAKLAAELAERKLLERVQRKHRLLSLTPAGIAAARAIDPAEVAGGTEVAQLTPELIAAWPTMDAKARAAVHLRPYDIGLPAPPAEPGKPHPLTHILQQIRHIFWSMGFQEIAGDYVESAHWNMDALFIPQDHPAREMQDTFYLKEPASIAVARAELDRAEEVHVRGGGTGSTGWGGAFSREVSQRALLRTHTTNTTIRYLAAHPTGSHKVFGLGRVFRKETMDATHLPEFTQIEGIVTEPGATFNMLVGLCRHFFAQMGFPEVRFRPAYFPYTEPSMEIDVLYNGRWMELGGCGIFRPEVTKPLGVENNVLAWGFGLERLAMMRLGLKDIRQLYISDIQWLRDTPMVF